MKKTWSQKSCGTAPLNFLLHVQHCTKWKHQILAVIPCQLETISHSHDCESTKRTPPHTHTLKWRKDILRAEGRILRTIPRKCSPLAQIRREKKKAWSSSTCLLYGPTISFMSRIHERTISLKFLDIILRVLRLEVSVSIFTLQTNFKPFLLKVRGRKIR